MKLTSFLLLISLLLIRQGKTARVTGYDCGNEATNLTTISLLKVAECDIYVPELNITTIRAQVLQIEEFKQTHVVQCYIKITRRTVHCGWFNVNRNTKKGLISYFKEVSREECMKMYETGSLRIANTQIYDIKSNSTVSHPIVFAGSYTGDKTCNGVDYRDAFGSYENVVVDGYVEITMQDYTATINLNKNKINLRSGTSCKLTDERCHDLQDGYTFWKSLPEDHCGITRYSVLYDGLVNKTQDLGDKQPTVYMLESDSITFGLAKTGQISICGYIIFRTEHPRLFINERVDDAPFVTHENSAVENIDLITYIDSKFVYTEKYIRKQVTQLYFDLLHHKCKIERQVLNNALAIATRSPDEFAYRLMREPGYMAVLSGEVIHLMKCIQVEVELRPSMKCYDQLPVSWNRTDYFLSPRTRMLIRKGNEIECNRLMPPMYYLNNTWIRFTPEIITGGNDPEILAPQSKPTWTYFKPQALALTGIYSRTDLERLRDRIMFPLERGPILNSVAMGMAGRVHFDKELSIRRFLDESTIEHIATSTWNKVWSRFISFGTASAGILGIFILMRMIKILVDTVIHGYAIYSIYGFSLHLIGAVWNSVTQLLLHLGRNIEQKSKEALATYDDEGKIKEQKFIEKCNEARSERIYEKIHPSVPQLYPRLERSGSAINLTLPPKPKE